MGILKIRGSRRAVLAVLTTMALIAGLLAFGLVPAAAKDDPDPEPGRTHRATGGPDAFGYTFIDSLEPGGPTFTGWDITATGTLLGDGDDVIYPVTLGAPFSLYGTTSTSAWFSTNGWIDIGPAGPTSSDFSNDCPIPTPNAGASQFSPRAMPYWDDIDLEPGIGTGWYEYFPVSPVPNPGGGVMGASIFQWHDAAHFPGGGAAPIFDFWAVLFDNGDMVYEMGAGNPELGSGASLGGQNPSGTVGLEISCNTPGSVPDFYSVYVAAGPIPECEGVPITVIGAGTFSGTPGNDVILGSTGPDEIDGLGGNDLICGLEGDDMLIGGDGRDQLYGHDGNDELTGGTKKDVLIGGAGDDLLDGGVDRDQLRGGLGNDTLEGGDGADAIFGDQGDDLINGGGGRDLIQGGNDRDSILGGQGHDTIYGNAGSDTIFGEGGNDEINGGAGEDDIFGGAGSDILKGGGSPDTIFGGSGGDTIFGGPGGDELRGEGGDDAISGEGGDDILTGASGYDTLDGGPGSNSCFSGEVLSNC